ncbi:long-chain-fatty-acid--CoA ligase [Peribacillus saganii]|uniref:Long-chain-fatty-acid--CoA ligase n=1 Tax=Peribacillus saganii TaxID=2303992 RepID=A0A372LMB1_9BACI|nr:long-chain fatty acid--CoA ligase [Peribacillus saganii]RFU67534.1 long-chain-fatty-acid--CoA ligase [Peribacillus saganii]
MYIADKLKEIAKNYPDQLITTYNNRNITYKDFYSQARKLAGFFQEKGYSKNDIVAVYLHNSDHFLTCYYACHIGGFTVLPVNTKLTAREVEFILNHSEAKALIYDSRFNDVLKELEPSLHAIEDRLVVGNEENGVMGLEAITQGKERILHEPDSQDGDTAVVFYTSGTTGRPKGVMLSNKNVAATAQIWAEAMEITSEDRMHIVTPLFHCAASHVFSIPVVYAGGSLVIEEAFSPEKTLETMEKEKVTIFFGVPAMYSILLNTEKLKTVDLSHLRLFSYGAAPMPYELVKQVKTLFPDVKVQNMYGQTENSPAATTLKDHYALSKIGSVGEMLPKTEVRVVDEYGEPLPVGQVGEIVVKGPQVMKGYLKNDEATQQSIKNGWLYSGDLGRFDEDGLLYIVDRKKDMIIRGGENVYPVEVEEILYEIPEILEAAVVGVPDQVLGEVPKAYVVTKENKQLKEDQIISYCVKRLASYKIPVEIEFLGALPRNASGKVLKMALRGKVHSD